VPDDTGVEVELRRPRSSTTAWQAIAKLLKLPKITRDMTAAELAEAQTLWEIRAHYAFVPHGARQPDGTQRLRGPGFWPPRVRSPL